MSMMHISSDNSQSELTEVQPTDVQPNATDLRVGKIFKIKSTEFKITNESKQHRGSVEVKLTPDGWYRLGIGTYEVIMLNNIKVAEYESGFVITRSTLNRNGAFLTSGLYDSGYEGVMAGVLHVECGVMKIKPGTRIGQYVMWRSEMIGDGYDGDYGSGKSHDEKYA